MGALGSLLRSLKLWQVAVLLVVAVGGAGGAYAVYLALDGSAEAALPSNQQLIPVQFGDLVNQVSTNGSLLFPDKETLTFGTQGTVAEVLVSEGDRVTEGQALARLDDSTIATLEKAVAQARVSLRKAEDALEKANEPNTPLQIAQAESSVASAKLSARNAQEALDKVATISEEDVAEAKKQVDTAFINLTNALNELEIVRKEWTKKREDAQEALDASADGYRRVFNKWLGIALTDEELEEAPKDLLQSWGADLETLFAPDRRYADLGQWTATQGLPVDDPGTRWNEASIYSWTNFLPAEIAPTCEDTIIHPQGVCIMQEMDGAWDAYQKAKDGLASTENLASKAIVKSESAVTQAQNVLDADQETLDELLSGPDALEVDAKEKQLKVAQENQAKAEEDLTEMLSGPDPLDVDLAEKDLASAQAALDSALEKLDGATLKAPMSGIVTIVGVSEGQGVNPNTPAIEVADPSVVEVDGVVDEIDVLFIREGTTATVTMDALPGESLNGVVSFVSSAARSQQGVVTYPIRIQLDVPAGIQLREGLSATANIVIQEEDNVLLVPTQAIYGTFQQPIVKVWNDGSIEDRPVALGNSDDFWVAVRDGLVEGERIILETAEVSTTGQFGFRAGAGLTGGLGGGGLRRGGGQQGGQNRPQR